LSETSLVSSPATDRSSESPTRSTAGTPVSPKIRRDVQATFASFALSGAVGGTWFSRIPAVREHLHADLRTVGFVLLCMGLGSLITMPFTGRITQRLSAPIVCRYASMTACLLMPILPFNSNTLGFAAVLLVMGGAYGMWDVTLNVHAASTEKACGKPIMPMLHGSWSAGLIVGSSIGALMAGAGVSLRLHFLLVMPVMLVLSVLATRWWTDHRVEAAAAAAAAASDVEGDHRTPGSPALAKTARVLTVPIILIGIMTMCSTLSEGAASDWLALYLHDDRGVSQGLAALIFTTYTVALTIGRFSGGGVLQRFGRVNTLRLSGCVTAAGIVATVVVPGIGGPFLGAILWGLGLSVVFPVAVTAAGDVGGKNAAGAISAVSTIAYGSFLAGPPLIGILAQDLSIGIALWFVAIMAFGITLLAPFTNPRRLKA